VKAVGSVLLALSILLGIPAGISRAQAPPRTTPLAELIMLTGSESATYFRIGRDLRRLLNEKGSDLGIDLAVVPSQGSVQNVLDVFRHPSIQLGITQTDVLSYLEIYAQNDPDARRILGGLQVVSPLYDEDVYLFARPGIKEIGDLSGKRISIGAAGSGTTVTALVLLHLAGVEPRELVSLDVEDAITAYRRGRIDAAFYVAGTPSDLLAEILSVRPNLIPIRLSPRPDEVPLARQYLPSTIPAHAYPWLDHAVETVKVRSVVITAGASPGSPECEAIGQLVRLVGDNLDWLRRSGHPKWKEIRPDRNALLADPRLSPCVLKALRQ
jgi:TRAP transporter TAXI family solute receptor